MLQKISKYIVRGAVDVDVAKRVPRRYETVVARKANRGDFEFVALG